MFVVFSLLIGLVLGGFVLYSNIQDKEYEKYKGHGFDYMHGYSSTDFTGYHVYDGEKLASLDHEPSLIIENEEDMPILDGAEACYPVYTAIAKTIVAVTPQYKYFLSHLNFMSFLRSFQIKANLSYL